VLHVELSGFDALLEELERSALQETVVGFRSLIYEAIFGNGGTVVWMHESSSLAIFGGQSTAESDAAWALSAATEMVREFHSLGQELGLPSPTAIRVGIDRGPVAVGVLGPNDRLLYTAMGTPVARARRICALGQAGGIHVTKRTLDQVPNPRGNVTELTDAESPVDGPVFRIDG
jgi:adenylate cyclase